MKITQPFNMPPSPSANNAKGAKARDAARSSDASANDSDAAAIAGSGAPAGRDFADILDGANNKSAHKDDDSRVSEWHNSTSKTEHADGERKTKRSGDDARDSEAASANASRGFDRLTARDVQAGGEVKSPRAILNIADLERIVSTIRTQFVAGNRREVTIDLHRSVLEGLRVKLSSDDTGRVTAEFISGSAAVKEQLDAHASGLADLLRSRGVDLASLKTSVGGDAAGQGDNSRGDSRDAPTPLVNGATAAPRNDSASANAAAPAAAPDHADGAASSTYRA